MTVCCAYGKPMLPRRFPLFAPWHGLGWIWQNVFSFLKFSRRRVVSCAPAARAEMISLSEEHLESLKHPAEVPVGLKTTPKMQPQTPEEKVVERERFWVFPL